MAIKSKKVLGEIRKLREKEAAEQKYLKALEEDGPNGVSADSDESRTLVKHWDESEEVI